MHRGPTQYTYTQAHCCSSFFVIWAADGDDSVKDGYGDFSPTTTRPGAHTMLLYTSWGCLESLRSLPYSTVDPRYDLQPRFFSRSSRRVPASPHLRWNGLQRAEQAYMADPHTPLTPDTAYLTQVPVAVRAEARFWRPEASTLIHGHAGRTPAAAPMHFRSGDFARVLERRSKIVGCEHCGSGQYMQSGIGIASP